MNQIPETENPATPLRFMHQRPESANSPGVYKNDGKQSLCERFRQGPFVTPGRLDDDRIEVELTQPLYQPAYAGW